MGVKKRIGNADGLEILEVLGKRKDKIETMEDRMEKMEKELTELKAKLKKQHDDIEPLKKTVGKLENIVEQHDEKWNKVRAYELLNIGSEFEEFKPSAAISLQRNEIVHGGDIRGDFKTLEYIKAEMGDTLA